MHILYEEDGQYKAGTIVTDNDTSLQIDTQFGKRAKVKAANVILRFASPAPNEFMETTRQVRTDLDVDFLWETAPEAEFSYEELAKAYFGNAPHATELAGTLQCLHDSPMYFYKKGRGRYRSAPADALAAAKASVVRKQREAALLDEYVAELNCFRLPDALVNEVDNLLYAPDKQQLPWRAVESACKHTGLTPLRLLDRCGALVSSHDYHLRVFEREYFPRGTGFTEVSDDFLPPEFPVADVSAFSIDDASTTEIDDAFSVQAIGEGRWRIGVHIAAPALGIVPASALDKIAATRLSTVYHPAGKITLLPESVIAAYSLNAGTRKPVLSMYMEVLEDGWQVLTQHSCVESIVVAANLRHEDLPHDLMPVSDQPEYPYQQELNVLWRLSGEMEARRGKTPDPNQPQRPDYQFRVEQDRVSITDRQRGNPVDRLVSEMMIHVNAEWGKLLAEQSAMALYRTQQNGKVKMSTKPAPHEGLGVTQYAWASSPLRRYVDLVNQRQLIAVVQGDVPPYPPKSETLYTVLRDFEMAYDAYAVFQRKMERYWCLRWLQQEQITVLNAGVIKENLVRLAGLPLVTRVSSLPEMPVASEVVLRIDEVDFLDVELHCTFQARLMDTAAG